MWTDAADLGVAAFMSMPGGDDQDIRAQLEGAGVEPWLAQRLVVWLPVAFGRRLLDGVAFSDECIGDPGIARLGADPTFVAAAARAARATRDEMSTIAMRSAEVRAVNAALHARPSAQLEDLQPGPLGLVDPLLPVSAGDGGILEPRELFAGFLRAHGHEPQASEGTASRVGELEIDARVYPRFADGVRVQVDFVIRHPRLTRGVLLESFAGIGRTWRDAALDATRKLERGSVHVIIAMLLDPTSCADQVTWERWPHHRGELRVCLGAQLLLYGVTGVDVRELVDALRDAVAGETLAGETLAGQAVGGAVHAIRVFTARRGELRRRGPPRRRAVARGRGGVPRARVADPRRVLGNAAVPDAQPLSGGALGRALARERRFDAIESTQRSATPGPTNRRPSRSA
ncbi:MAG: DUF6348 family protein [Myxococcota bacterium]|nr:DUF6348 family protein [Myxococcota bacterium]